MLFLLGALFTSLLCSEYCCPELINRYPSEMVRMIDVGISFLMVFALLIYAVNTIKNELDYNREIAEDRAKLISDQKESVDELNTKMTKLFSIIAHDLKAPLPNVKTTMQLLQNGDAREMGMDELIPKLDRDIGLTINMLDNLLRWSKQQLSGVVVSPEILNLSDSFNDTLKLVNSYAEIKDVGFQWFIQDQIKVNIDPESLKLVVRHLAINAVKYSRKTETVSINCQTEDEYVVMNFIDTGIGISNEKLSQLFELGTDSQPGTNNEVGAGLGLYLSQTIIEAYQGSLKARSEQGEGSTFTLRIPRGK